jgi:nucleotide-binding universal stress UspA family protein
MTGVSEFFRRILVPVDFGEADPDSPDTVFVVRVEERDVAFSAPTIRAIRMAAELAAAHQGVVRLMHATPPLQSAALYTGPVMVPAALLEELHGRAREASVATLRMLAEIHCTGISVEFIAEASNPVNLVLEQAQTWSADLVIMAASGRSRVSRFFVGSTADRVIRQCHCPVLVVPADGHA